MKIITWNAAMRFRDKFVELPFSADVLVIPECEAPDKWKNNNLQKVEQFLWFGDNLNKGLGVFSLDKNLKLQVHPSYKEVYRYIIPIEVTGQENFLLFAVWTQMVNKRRYDSYIGQIYLALKEYENLLKENQCLIIGDWKSIKMFDKIKRVGTHTDVVNTLKSFKIHSAYHQYFNEEHGFESQPTHYFRKEKQRPFHLDYLFASESILDRLEHLQVGTHDEWISLSDHMPIFASFK